MLLSVLFVANALLVGANVENFSDFTLATNALAVGFLLPDLIKAFRD